jgi:Tol biopolymer transport system component
MNKTAVVLFAALAVAGLSVRAEAQDVKPVKPVSLAVNTDADEDDPFLSSSGLTLWYASNAKGKFDIMVAQRRSAVGPWAKGRLLEDYVRTEVDDRGVCLTRDAVYPQYLYFATKKDKETKNFDIYVAVKQGRTGVFTEPTPVNAVDSEADEMHPWLMPDGKQLWFSRKTAEGWRVFTTRRAQATGAQGFGEAMLVEDLPPDFHHVTLTRDGKTMYLQGPLGDKRVGLFVATKTAKGWSKPEPLTMLNHPDAPRGDCSPSLSADGMTLYFASDRPGGKGGFDVYSAPTAQLKLKK